jgi:hypothetical protein
MKRKKTLKRRSFKNRPLRRRKTLKRKKTLKRRRRRRTKLNRKRGGAADKMNDTIRDISTGSIDVKGLSETDKETISSSLSTMKEVDNRRYSDIIMAAITSDRVADDNLRFLLKTVGNTGINAWSWQKPGKFADVFTEKQPLMDILNKDECCNGFLRNKSHKGKVKRLLLEFIPHGHQPINRAVTEADSRAEAELSAGLWSATSEVPPETGGHCIIS